MKVLKAATLDADKGDRLLPENPFVLSRCMWAYTSLIQLKGRSNAVVRRFGLFDLLQ